MSEHKHIRSIVLASGGIDSAVSLLMAKENSRQVLPLYVDYGQASAEAEFQVLQKFCSKYGITKPEYADVQNISNPLGKCSFLECNESFTINDYYIDIGGNGAIGEEEKPCIVPYRNFLLLIIAFMYSVNSYDIVWTGFDENNEAPALDEYEDVILRFEDVLSSVNDGWSPVSIVSPCNQDQFCERYFTALDYLIEKNVDLGLTYSCENGIIDLNGEAAACGVCAKCISRLRMLQDRREVDTAHYLSFNYIESSVFSHDVEVKVLRDKYIWKYHGIVI